jgi:hypothetical protein
MCWTPPVGLRTWSPVRPCGAVGPGIGLSRGARGEILFTRSYHQMTMVENLPAALGQDPSGSCVSPVFASRSARS